MLLVFYVAALHICYICICLHICICTMYIHYAYASNIFDMHMLMQCMFICYCIYAVLSVFIYIWQNWMTNYRFLNFIRFSLKNWTIFFISFGEYDNTCIYFCFFSFIIQYFLLIPVDFTLQELQSFMTFRFRIVWGLFQSRLLMKLYSYIPSYVWCYYIVLWFLK